MSQSSKKSNARKRAAFILASVITLIFVVLSLTAPSPVFAENIAESEEPDQKKVVAPVDPAILNQYVGLMSRKIRRHMNPRACPVSSPEVIVEMQLTNTGDIAEMPKLVESTGNSTCDESMLKAIVSSKPFDLPYDHPEELKRMLEKIQLKFRPQRM